MLTAKQIERMLSKLRRFEDTLEPRIFEKKAQLEARAYVTKESLYGVPDSSKFQPVEKGWHWGGESAYCWFTAQYTVSPELDGRDVFIRPEIGGYEAMLFVGGVPFGTFNGKIVFTGHGNHYCNLLKKAARAGETIDIALEYYAGHAFKGCMPLEDQPLLDYDFYYDSINVCVKNEEIQDFYFNLKTLNQLAEILPKTSYRRAGVINTLCRVHETLLYSPADTDEASFIRALREAAPLLKEALAVPNGPEAPFAALIGHSHMDTAWLWHVGETVKKCARTYSNQVSLMQQYPEYKFIQSSACHGDMILRHYPALFEQLKKLISEGRYEPNGGVWVECDCNITGGESMVRQFLWGQRFTRRYFGYTSNCFWLPDTFGYSAAIPQIMKGCGVDYFLTTKIGWNDTNAFPYDTFIWKGLDGTAVFAHFNVTHCWPDAATLNEVMTKGYGDTLRDTSVTPMRLVSYGYGDGGGGPQFEMIEMGRRCADLNGCPKASYMRAGDFMRQLEAGAVNPNTYTGELYLELHRGTLTNQHNIKRNNRKAELALRDLELFIVADAAVKGVPASSEKTEPLYGTLLLNQFHDILPGTCIPRVHIESLEQTTAVIETARREVRALAQNGEQGYVTLTNTLSFDRQSPAVIDIEGEDFFLNSDAAQQIYSGIDGKRKLIACGLPIPAFTGVSFAKTTPREADKPPFIIESNRLQTPFARVEFDERGFIASFTDTRTGRQLRAADGYPFNTFLMAEDLPSAWDNWDVDADIEGKFRDTAVLLNRELVSLGAAAAVWRSVYSVSAKSTVTQDMIFFSGNAEVRFDTLIDWRDDHRFLKTAFDTCVNQDFARCEVQFGYVKRPTTRNNSLEKAKFEVLNHKYTDISETRGGAAVLNDCKYAVSVEEGKIRLSLHKGGNRPDFRGDKGLHRCVYAFLPHDTGFGARSVIRPAYELNVPLVLSPGIGSMRPLLLADADNIIIETVKPCEDSGKAFIARLYDAEGTYTRTRVRVFDDAKAVELTNMLEEPFETVDDIGNMELEFRPFEIKTLKVIY
ncbi:MAG TPA: glycoside hydrolase family 38 C-terminal domain-containing protein [Clostridiales bacterium]|nr:glycoside hydrolase family 38 C-terminal domain-containing protein [Clostridiales bacterium]HQH63188.1 glycoside hydrolase family 38 C-terminal domain-containing protein [Clostridiales bacterium]HQK73762.1 glycoside hydrolase family 38 C-terminal domain-containing protein [Clostridiales bacterium]